MNKRHLIIGIVVIVVVCAAAFIGISTAEKKVEASVREVMANLGASAKKVSYSFLSGELVLDDVTYTLTVLGIKEDALIRQIVVTDPDMDAFDPAVPGRPRVAKRIVLSGVEQHAASEGLGLPPASGSSVFTCEEIVFEGWRQNVGKVIELSKTKPGSEAFFTALFDSALDSFTYANARTTSAQGDAKFEWSMEKASGKDLHDDLLSCEVEKITFKGSGILDLEGSIGRAGVTDLRLPSPRMLAALVEMYPVLAEAAAKVQQEPGTAEELLDRLQTRMRPLFKEYVASTPYRTVRVEGVVVRESGEPQPAFSLKSYSNSLSFSLPYRFEIGLQDLFVPGGLASLREGGTPDVRIEIPDLRVRDLLLNADLKLGIPAAPELSSLAVDVKVRDLGSLSGVFALNFPEDQLPLLLGPHFEQWFMQVGLGKSRLSYTDGGFLPRLLAALSSRAGLAPAALLPALDAQIDDSLSETPFPGLETAVQQMLNKPGTLTMEFNPSAPLPVPALLAAFMMAPDSLGIRVEATPGPESILEAIPADMRQTAP